MHKNTFLIGAASAFSGDRQDAAGPVVDSLISSGKPAALIYETLAERTLALAQIERRNNPNSGFDPWLEDIVGPVLKRCIENRITIIGNFGAANPLGAANRLRKIALEQGLEAPRIAVIEGDDVSGSSYREYLKTALGDKLDEGSVVSANVYLGADSIADAILAGAQIIVAGRVSDPALTVGPLLAHFKWSRDDWSRRGKAVMIGHVLECGCQATGGYFADPGYKDVPDLAHVGFPIAEVDENGDCIFTKPAGTGGLVVPASIKEQLLYELDDPASYITPDAVADISDCSIESLGSDRVVMKNVKGHPWPATLKVLVCHEGGWLAEAEISYAGPRAESRARLAAAIVRERIGNRLPLRVDLIGALSLHADDAGEMLAHRPPGDGRDIRLRISTKHDERRQADILNREVMALYTCGPAGGGGVRTSLKPRLSTTACFLPRELFPSSFSIIV